MPFREQLSAQFYDIEVLKYPAGLDAIKSVVIDATGVTMNTDTNARTVIPAGTILQKNASGKQMIPYKGTASTLVTGILARSVDILSAATSSFEPAPMFFHQCVFVTTAIVGFTQYAATLVSALPTCKFEGK